MARKVLDSQTIPNDRTCSLNHNASSQYDRRRPWYGFIRPRTEFRDIQDASLPSNGESIFRFEEDGRRALQEDMEDRD